MLKKIIHPVWPLMVLALMLSSAWASAPDDLDLDKSMALISQKRVLAVNSMAADVLENPLILAGGGGSGGGGSGAGGGSNTGGISGNGQGPHGGQQLGSGDGSGKGDASGQGIQEQIRNQRRYRYQDSDQEPEGEQQQHRYRHGMSNNAPL